MICQLTTVWPDFEIKSSPIFSKSIPKNCNSRFSWKWLFRKAQKVTQHLGYFCMNINNWELSKIAQSGHTGYRSTHLLSLSFGWVSIFPANFVLTDQKSKQSKKYLRAWPKYPNMSHVKLSIRHYFSPGFPFNPVLNVGNLRLN